MRHHATILHRLKTCVNLRLISSGSRWRKEAFYYFCTMVKKHTVFLLPGSNIHPRTAYLKKAIELISSSVGLITIASSLYESEPWGFDAPIPFLNQVLCVETTMEPMQVLEKTQAIERQLGRTTKSNGAYISRTLDIDILFFDDEIIDLPELTIPHAQITNRRFTLMPLVEITPQKEHPVLKKTCLQLLDTCLDEGKVWKFKKAHAHAL